MGANYNDTKVTHNQFDDYSLQSVPTEQRKSIFNISITSCAWIISLSTLFTGGALVTGLNFADAVIAGVVGMLILAIIGFFQGWMGGRYGVSTTMLARQAFGRYGSNLLGALLAITMGVGWFGWQISFFGLTLAEMFPNQWFAEPKVAMVWGGILMMLTALIGYRGLSSLSMIAVPLVTILSIWGLIAAVQELGNWGALVASQPIGETMSLFDGITIVVGNAVAGAIVFADVTRYGRSGAKGGLGASVGYFFGGLFCIVAGSAMAMAAQLPTIGSTPNIPAAMSQIGLGFFAFLILVFAQWTTNDSNLYTGSLGLRNVIRLPKSVLVFAMGSLGLLIALLGIHDYFVPFLNFLGTYVPPIAGVMIIDHWVIKPKVFGRSYQFGSGTTYAKWNLTAIASVIVGGFASSRLEFGLQPVNAIIIALVVYLLLSYLLKAMNIQLEIGEKQEEKTGF